MSYLFVQSDACRLPLADKSVDLTFCSPPYLFARTYGINAQRDCAKWIDWMLDVVTELTRVTNGLVLVNCAGMTKNRVYRPGPEGLLYEWWKRGGHCWRPAYWHRVGISGGGGKHWLRPDMEYVLCFKGDNEWPSWSDNTACGTPPKYGPGGPRSNRLADGSRVYRRTGNPKITNPGNLIHVPVGGGMMGHPMASLNEAPFPMKLPEFLIKSFCRPVGIVFDPFSGSGTTVDAANKLGRHAIGSDLRFSQCELGMSRMRNPVIRKEKSARKKLVATEVLF